MEHGMEIHEVDTQQHQQEDVTQGDDREARR